VTRQKPIRKDRVFLAAAVVLAAIVVPILWPREHVAEPSAKPVSGEAPTPSASAATAPASAVSTAEDTAGPAQAATSREEGSSPGAPETQGAALPAQPLVVQYTVKQGETLSRIASSLGASVEQLMASNRILSPEALTAGQVLRVSRLGILHLVRKGQTLGDLSLTYGVPVKEIAETNGIGDPERIDAGAELVIPGGSPDVWENVIRLSLGKETRFIRPVEGKVVGFFGWRIHPVLAIPNHHDGIDFDVPVGTAVTAAAAGRGYFVGEQEGPGTLVILEHEDGYYTAYAHLSKALVRVGQFVEAGQPIARSGNTGISSGPHLHFEIRNRDFSADPLQYLP